MASEGERERSTFLSASFNIKIIACSSAERKAFE
jgi:hypothetical protein